MLWIHTGFNANPDPISEFGFGEVPSFDQKWENFTTKKSSFQKNVKLLFIYPQASMKEIQAKEEAFSLQKENIQHLKHKISPHILFLYVIFALLDPDSDLADQNQRGFGYRSTTLEQIYSGIKFFFLKVTVLFKTQIYLLFLQYR